MEAEKMIEIAKEPYQRALDDDSDGVQEFFKNKPADTLFIPLTPCRDTVFHIAAYKASAKLLQVLLRMVPADKKIGEVLKMKNAYGNTVLHEVAAAGNIQAADCLISEVTDKDVGARKEIVEERNNLGETPLFKAAACGETEMVEYLARQVEANGQSLSGHFRRDDDISVLQAAVLGQHFETAIWLVNKDGDLADYKDNSGKTCLHLLASMPVAFRSTSPMVHLKRYAYSCIHTEAEKLESNASKDLERGEAVGSSKVKGWKTMKEIYKEKKKHESAVKLAKMLVKRDKSWFVPNQRDWSNTICLDRQRISEPDVNANSTSKSPDTPLLIAARTGISEIFEEILNLYPQAVEHVNEDGQNVLHVATMHRQYGIFHRLKKMEVARRRLVAEIDKDGCTVLHHAALTQYYGGGTKPTAALQLQEEWKWFKEVESMVPENYTMHRNRNNHTAEELFNIKHEEQHAEAKKWVKDTSQSCSAVAVLIATVVFAAAFTVPGGSKDDGKPVLLNHAMYSFFTVMDVAAVATSLTAVVIFLSVLTSSLELKEFVGKVPRRMSLGFIFLFSSVTSTMLAFTATIILTIKLQKRWSTTLTYAAAFLPIGVFALVQFPLYFQYCVTVLRSIYEVGKKILGV